MIWRRSYDVAAARRREPEGHAARVLPYYMHEILPRVLRGETRAGGRARQFAARADHGARQA